MGRVCSILAIQTHQPIGTLLDLIHGERRVFDSLWYTAFPPESAHCDVDAILDGKVT